MPALQNARYEAFAQARARGAKLDDAYEDAGFGPANGHASRVALRSEVIERVAELRREQAEAEDASPQAIVAALVRMARASEALNTTAGVKEARQNLLEARRLQAALAWERVMDRSLA
jgi:hypothetical protein